MLLTDEEIIYNLKVKGKENYAFNHLIKKYRRQIYLTIRYLVNDYDDINDLIQDVFIKVWNKISEFRSESKLYTWIYRIAVNETINFIIKKRKRFVIPFSNIGKKFENVIYNDGIFDADEIQNKLKMSVLTLPEKQRNVFLMKYYDNLTYEQMSEILGTSEGALKASYHFAVTKIEKLIFKVDCC